MHPSLELFITLTIRVDRPIVIFNDPGKVKRQLIPISGGEMTGRLRGRILPGGVDSQVIDREGVCRLSARYGVETEDGKRFFIENNGIRRVPARYLPQLFADDMAFFSTIPPGEIYFFTTPTFEVADDSLSFLQKEIFIGRGTRGNDGLVMAFYQLR